MELVKEYEEKFKDHSERYEVLPLLPFPRKFQWEEQEMSGEPVEPVVEKRFGAPKPYVLR